MEEKVINVKKVPITEMTVKGLFYLTKDKVFCFQNQILIESITCFFILKKNSKVIANDIISAIGKHHHT